MAIYLLRLFCSSLFFHFQFLAEHQQWLPTTLGTSTIYDISVQNSYSSVLPLLENRWNPNWRRVRTKAHHWHRLHIIRVSFVLPQDLQIIRVCFNYPIKDTLIWKQESLLNFHTLNKIWWMRADCFSVWRFHFPTVQHTYMHKQIVLSPSSFTFFLCNLRTIYLLLIKSNLVLFLIYSAYFQTKVLIGSIAK